jgi:hypothetical protein
MSDERSDSAPANPLPVGAMIPQKHGGALRNGGTNRGGPGRPPVAVRADARHRFDKHLKTLDRIASARKSTDHDKVRAIAVLGRFGMDQNVNIDDVRSALKATNEEIREFLSPEQAEVLIGRIRQHWAKL